MHIFISYDMDATCDDPDTERVGSARASVAIAAAAAWVSSRRASANKTATAETAASPVGCRPRLPTARAEGADK